MKTAGVLLALAILQSTAVSVLAQQLPRAEVPQRKRFDASTTRQLTALGRVAVTRSAGCVCATLSGGSSTDRTEAAQLVADSASMPLYRVDLSRVVSQYIGETEKNLDRLFERARDAHWTLFFDEADDLFGKRSETRDSRDRYATLDTASLLKRIEQYPGLVLLATHELAKIDPAFIKRCAPIRTATVP